MNEEKLISPVEYTQFITKFYTGKFPHQRFGQAFLNDLFPEKVDAKLFYEENNGICHNIIVEGQYIDWSKSSVQEIMGWTL